ncbi:Ig-like domain-containing protein [Eubacterium callanderi]|uniref:Ig-like domain-containing protein n=1 Tax=Eubacterium callanderi TaxID=53442 RepID=UPI001D136F19|nr:Ig-like domain-containing protein [Eubacterium callanderi]MCC3402604.1 DUF4430 domain-containing protein [Eubacterium callanderi]
MQRNKPVKWTKRLLVLLITVAMLFSMLPVSVFAEETEKSNEVEEALNTETTVWEDTPWYERFADVFKIVEPAYIESMSAEKLADSQYKDSIIQNDLLTFDPSIKNYTVKTKNDKNLKYGNISFTTNKEVSDVKLKTVDSDGEIQSEYSLSGAGNEKREYNFSYTLPEWSHTDYEICLNYGTKASPRFKTYTIHLITDSEKDSELEMFELIPYAGDQPADIVKTIDPSGFSFPYHTQIIDTSADKLLVKAVPHSKGAQLNLTYTRFNGKDDAKGEEVTIPIEGESITLTDCYSDAIINSGRVPYLDFTITVTPKTNQEARSYTQEIIRGNYSPYIFEDLRVGNTKTLNTSGTENVPLVSKDSVQGYQRGVYNYALTLFDRGLLGGGDDPQYINNKLILNVSNTYSGSDYITFDGIEYNLSELKTKQITSQELEPGKHNNVELKVYKDADRKEESCQVYTFDISYLPSLRPRSVTSEDENFMFGDDFTNGFFINDATSATIKFDIPDNSKLYWSNYFGEAVKEIPMSTEKEAVVTLDDVNNNTALMITGTTTLEGDKEALTYSIYYSLRYSEKKISPTAPTAFNDFWPAPGQFVNDSGWGHAPNNGFEVLKVSLGGFGGYITSYFEDPITNDPGHSGGVDFTVEGNGFDGNSEPGNVLVSEDGVTWYTLAGGYHYEDDCVWDYQLTYSNKDAENPESVTNWKDSLGNKGQIKPNGFHSQPYYPLTENYGKYRTEENGRQYGNKYNDGTIPSEYTMSGVLLPGRVTSWGYADAAPGGITGPSTGKAMTSPYNGYSGFDLDWAVDKNGNPVDLNEVHYVKVQNATNQVLAGVGELSPEVVNVNKVSSIVESTIRTAPVESIVINGQLLTFDEEDTKDGIVERTVYYKNEKDAFDVDVTLPESTTMYYSTLIGNGTGTSRHYDKVPEHKMIRVITQDNRNEPVSYFIKLEQSDDFYGMTLNQSSYYLKPQESTILKPVFTPKAPEDASIEWSTSDETVAVVDQNGQVTAIANGEAIITGYSRTTNVKASCKIKVGDTVESITMKVLSGNPDGVKPGNKLYLSASYLPNNAIDSKTVTWSSDNESVAKIGTVTNYTGQTNAYIDAIDTGKATITAQTQKGVAATLEINVLPKEVQTAIFSVEKFTIGQGYLIEPMQVEFAEGDSAAQVVTKALKEAGYEYTYTGEIGNSFYLSSIKNADNGTFNPPQEIQDMPSYITNVSGVNERAPDLGEFAYGGQSGWIYHVNDVSPSVGMDNYKLKDGDVLRLQFTLNGLGADLGGGSYEGGDEVIPVAKKSALTSRVADWNMNRDYFLNIQQYKEAYDNAMNVLNKYMASQEEVDAAAAAMPYNEAIPVTDVKVMSESGEALEEMTLTKGESQQLTASLEPADASDQSLSWTSDNENVAVVGNNGHITAVGEGETTIRVKANGGAISVARGIDPLTKTIKVTVRLTDNQAAARVQEMILAIGSVTLDKEAEILNARAAYDKLSDEAKALVTNIADLEAAEAALAERKAPVNALTTQIQALPATEALTLGDQAKVKEARTNYEALEADQQNYLDKDVYQKLEAAEAQMKVLEQQADDQAKADAVTELIKSLPAKDELTLAMKPMVTYARAAYDALSEAQQALVPSETLQKLTEAEAQMLALEAEADADAKASQVVTDQIAQLGEITSLDQAKAVAEARGAYEALTEAQKALIGADTLKALEKAEAAIAKLTTEAKDQAAAQAVIDQIAALPSADQLTLEDKAAVEAARTAYNSLSETQRSYVSEDSLKTLEAAEEQIARLEETEPDPEPTPTPEPTPPPTTPDNGSNESGSGGSTGSGNAEASNTATGITNNATALWGSLALIAVAAGITGSFVSRRRKVK